MGHIVTGRQSPITEKGRTRMPASVHSCLLQLVDEGAANDEHAMESIQ